MLASPSMLAMMFAIAALLLCLERLRRVHLAKTFDLEALARALGRTGDAERLRQLQESMNLEHRETWESELVRIALEARSPAACAALVNEQLGDVESALGWGSRVHLAAARLAVAGPLCVLFFSLARGAASLSDIVAEIAWGGAGLVGSLAIGREADQIVVETRKGVDVWVARVLDAARASVPPSDVTRS